MGGSFPSSAVETSEAFCIGGGESITLFCLTRTNGLRLKNIRVPALSFRQTPLPVPLEIRNSFSPPVAPTPGQFYTPPHQSSCSSVCQFLARLIRRLLRCLRVGFDSTGNDQTSAILDKYGRPSGDCSCNRGPTVVNIRALSIKLQTARIDVCTLYFEFVRSTAQVDIFFTLIQVCGRIEPHPFIASLCTRALCPESYFLFQHHS